MEVKNLKKAAERIKKAVKNKENIVIFSDADLDGVTSLLVMEETLKSLGNEIKARYIPNREEEGYGLNEGNLQFFAQYSPALLLILDSGMSNAKEIERGKELGLETIIIDHHEPLQEMPDCLVVNPKQKDDKYPFKQLAACGVVFKVAQTVLGKELSKNTEESFLEMVALGTIADMMPPLEDNEVFIERGVTSLPITCRPGLRAFFRFFPPETFSARELAQKIISTLQLTDFQGHLTESYLALSCQDEKEAEKLIELLIEKQANRHELIRSFFEEIKAKVEINKPLFILEGGQKIPHLLTGNIASKLCNNFQKPTFIFASKGSISRGSVRTPKTVNGVLALDHCRSLLEIYGGHAQAAGFTIKTHNLGKFKRCLTNYFS